MTYSEFDSPEKNLVRAKMYADLEDPARSAAPPRKLGRVRQMESEKAGKKYDEGKLRYDLLDPFALREVARVISFGAAKYGDDNWRELADAKKRYAAALMRHFEAWRMGETLDKDSGIHHLAHCATNALFLLWFERGDGK